MSSDGYPASQKSIRIARFKVNFSKGILHTSVPPNQLKWGLREAPLIKVKNEKIWIQNL